MGSLDLSTDFLGYSKLMFPFFFVTSCFLEVFMARKFGIGIFFFGGGGVGGLNFGPGIFLGFDFCPHLIIPIT